MPWLSVFRVVGLVSSGWVLDKCTSDRRSIRSIRFSKMHCTVTATRADDSFFELIFRSDSINWNTEVFTRINLDPDTYINRKAESYDPAVTVLHDGQMTFDFPCSRNAHAAVY